MSALLQSLAEGFREDAPNLSARREALARAQHIGLPLPRSEAWKYTSLRALERRQFASSQSLPKLDSITLPPAPRLVFVNGWFDANLSDVSGLPEGVKLHTLSQTERVPAKTEASNEVFVELNAALAIEGACLHVAAQVQVQTPLHLVFVGVPEASDIAHALCHRIELAQGAQLALAEHHIATGEHANLSNALMQIELREGARLDHLRIQSEAVAATSFLRTQVRLAQDASCHRVDLELGAGLSRHELNVALAERNANLHANGVLLADGRRHLDTRLGIDHAAHDTAATLQWRALASDRSRAVFHGGILIREGADGANAQLSNKNLLLSEDAEIDTQPVLEIHADEVQASHGATVGSLDTTALFYLRSRGLSEAAARNLLTAAFCREVIDANLPEALREAASVALDAQLAGLPA